MADLIRALAMRVVWANYGRWYKWGGDDPSAFDCSGLMLEVLKSVGKFPRGEDTTADGLFRHFHMHEIPERDLTIGCLVFWLGGNDDKAKHVEMVIQVDGKDVYCMGASGGGSSTLTVRDAVEQNAFIKVRPMKSRGGTRAYVDPFREVGRLDV